MDNKALEIVKNYILEHLDRSDPEPEFDVYTVWKAKALQNWKYLLSSTWKPGTCICWDIRSAAWVACESG